MSKNENIGVITEIGDLGLGFNPLTESEKEQISKNTNKGDKEE